MRAVILGGGDSPSPSFVEKACDGATLVICADAGAEIARTVGIRPSVLIGDMDSVSEDTIDYFKTMGVEVICVSSEKDETDMQLALDYAIEKNASEIIILGGIGGRLDHTMSNIHLLARARRKNVDAKLCDEKQTVLAVNKHIIMTAPVRTVVSILPFEEHTIVKKTEGLKYALENEELPMGMPFAVSNEMTKPQAKITIAKGLAVVFILHSWVQNS